MKVKYRNIFFCIIILSILIYLTKFSTRDNAHLFNEAYELAKNEKYQEANLLLDKAIEYKPNDIYCYNNRAWNYFTLKEYEKAEKDFNKVVELKKNNTLGLFGIGMVKYNQKDYKNALLYFNRIIELTGGERTLYVNFKMEGDRELKADVTKVVYYRDLTIEKIKPNR